MSTARVDLFTTIHKGLRRLLLTAVADLGRTNLGTPEGTESARRELRRLTGFLDEHSHHEDMNVLPLVAAQAPALAQSLARDHAELSVLQRELTRLAVRLDDAAALSSTLHRLVAGHLQHMDREEREANAVLWQRYSDPELAAARAKITQSIAPDRYIEWLQLVVPALSAPEREQMLGALEANAPAAFFHRITQALALTGAGHIEVSS